MLSRFQPKLTRRQICVQRLAGWITASVVVAGVFVFPGEALAKGGYVVYPGGIRFVLPVKRTDGYVVSVSASGQRVTLKLDGTPLVFEYSTHGHVNGRRIEARFGRSGRVNVKLRLIRRPLEKPHRGRCRGRAPVYREGSYSGRIELPDEGGEIPSGSATHGHVYVTRRFRQVCKRRHRRPRGIGKHQDLKAEVAVLNVSGRTEGRFARIRAFELRPRTRPAQSTGYLDAAVSERLDEMRVTRRIGIPITGESFELSPPGEVPETATIELAKPFEGSAAYLSGVGVGSNWTGDLSVGLPMIGRIPLAGSGFTAVFCRAASVPTLERCSRV